MSPSATGLSSCVRMANAVSPVPGNATETPTAVTDQTNFTAVSNCFLFVLLCSNDFCTYLSLFSVCGVVLVMSYVFCVCIVILPVVKYEICIMFMVFTVLYFL